MSQWDAFRHHFAKTDSLKKGEAVITDCTNNLSLIITSLGINLIEKHNFFQGRGCRFRIDRGLQ